MYKSIITHNDFDGIVSASICSFVYRIDFIFFTGPSAITRSQTPVTKDDIVCDLPYPLECGLWFDHHEGNSQELEYRGIDVNSIAGSFELKPSCADVVYTYFSKTHRLPAHFEDHVREANIIDAFDYKDLQDWRSETPGKIIDASIKIREDSIRAKNNYLKRLVLKLRKSSLAELAETPGVQDRYNQYLKQEGEIIQMIRQNAFFLPQDEKKEIVFLDFTAFNRRPYIIKNLAYLEYPDSLAVVEIQSLHRQGVKSNDISFSMSVSLNLKNMDHLKDVGEIMRELNLGDGHAGAAAGTLPNDSKQEMIKGKEETMDDVFRIWKAQ